MFEIVGSHFRVFEMQYNGLLTAGALLECCSQRCEHVCNQWCNSNVASAAESSCCGAESSTFAVLFT